MNTSSAPVVNNWPISVTAAVCYCSVCDRDVPCVQIKNNEVDNSYGAICLPCATKLIEAI